MINSADAPTKAYESKLEREAKVFSPDDLDNANMLMAITAPYEYEMEKVLLTK